MPHADLAEPLAHKPRHHRVIRRIPNRNQQKRTLVIRPTQHFLQEPHRAGRVRQRRQPGMMQRGKQHPRRDPHRLVRVVRLPAIIGLHQLEHHDQPRRDLQERLPLVGAKRPQILQPRLTRAAAIELPLLRLGGLADLGLQTRITNHNKPPRLLVRPAGGRARRQQARLDHLPRHRTIAEHPHRPPPVHDLVKPPSRPKSVALGRVRVQRHETLGDRCSVAHGPLFPCQCPGYLKAHTMIPE